MSRRSLMGMLGLTSTDNSRVFTTIYSISDDDDFITLLEFIFTEIEGAFGKDRRMGIRFYDANNLADTIDYLDGNQAIFKDIKRTGDYTASDVKAIYRLPNAVELVIGLTKGVI